LPDVGVLNFPVNELVERLVDKVGPNQGLPYLENPTGYGSKIKEFVYNIPDVGSRIEVDFYVEKLDFEIDWSLVVNNPNIKPFELFNKEQIEKTCDKSDPTVVFSVISGPLKGALIYDFSLDKSKGFLIPNDRSIVVFSKVPNYQANGINIGCK
jgi:hypothetical protein